MSAFRPSERADADERGNALMFCWRSALGCARIALSLLALVGIALVVLVALAFRGPVSLPGAAGWIEDAIEQDLGEALEGARVEIGEVVLSLGRGEAGSEIELRDVRLTNAAGATILSAPSLAVEFDLSDAMSGRFQPRSIVLTAPEALLLRTADGRYLFGLTPTQALSLDGGEGDAASEGTGDLPMIVDGIAGDGSLPPALQRLERVTIREARLAYRDLKSGRQWRSEDALIALERLPFGARLTMEAELVPVGPLAGDAPPLRLSAEAWRRQGAGTSVINMALDGAWPADIGSQVAELDWLSVVAAPLDGRLFMTIADSGRIIALGGNIAARPGVLPGAGGRSLTIETLALSFNLQPGSERLRITALEIASGPITGQAEGFLALERGQDEALASVVAQMTVTGLRIDLPRMFDRVLDFDSGQIVARIALEPLAITLGEARLASGPLDLVASGQARLMEEGWLTDLRLVVRNMTVEELIAHWPLIAAENARDWVAEHMLGGEIDEVLALVRLAPGAEPELTLDFIFRETAARFVDGMPPVSAAAGRGHLDVLRFEMELDEGMVAVPGGGELDIAGSSFAIEDVDAETTIGDVRLVATGSLDAVLRLIDTPPLSLLSRMDPEADFGPVSGRAWVRADLTLPLLKDLPIEDVGAQITARLEDVSMMVPAQAMGQLAITAPRLDLEADTQGLRIAGTIVLDGERFRVDWRERFDAAGTRELTLAGALTPARVLAMAPKDMPSGLFRSGRIPFTLALRQRGGGAASFTVRADLGPAGVALPSLAWGKAEGSAGTLALTGSMDAAGTFRQAEIAIEAEGLALEGDLTLDEEGAFERLAISRILLADRADLSAEIWFDRAGALRARVQGRRLDLTETLAGEMPEGSGGSVGTVPIRAEIAIDKLYLSEDLVIADARGEYLRTGSGAAQARLEGRIGGGARAVLDYAGGAGLDERIRITAEDAGAVLRDAGYFPGGFGGALELNALIAPAPGITAQGLAVVTGMAVANADTLQTILAEGDAADLSAEVASGGFYFDRIEIPFVYGNGRVELLEAVATSPSLAIKVEGIYDETRDAIEMSGVISPAYAVTGFLDQIPLLGTILSGGQGEGIFAMTFTASGSAASPEVDVQPLSLLAPGILRRVFQGGGEGAIPQEEFLDRIERDHR